MQQQYAGHYSPKQGVDAHGALLLIRNESFTDIGGNVTPAIEISGNTPIWLPVGQVTSITSPKVTTVFHDVTPAVPGAWKQYVPGYKDPGTVTLGLLYDFNEGSHQYLLDSFTRSKKEEFRLHIDALRYWGFEGYVSGFSTSYSAGNVVIGNVSFRLTGAVDMSTLRGDEIIWSGVYDSDEVGPDDIERINISV